MVQYTKICRMASVLVLAGMIVSLPACGTGQKTDKAESAFTSAWNSVSSWGREKLSALYSVVGGKGRMRSSLNFDKGAVQGDEYAVVVVGSGPAALAAGLTTGRYQLKTLMIDGPLPGGQLTETSVVENWIGEPRIGGQELINKFTEHMDQYGVEHLGDSVTSVDFTKWPFEVKTEGGKTIRALSVVIATGAAPVKLSIPGEDNFYGRGVSTCAKCDAGLFNKDKDEVVIIGGGDTAAEMALQLSGHAKKVTILVRKDRMRASASIRERMAEYPNIAIMYNVDVIEFLGTFNQTFKVTTKSGSEKKVAHTKAEERQIQEAARKAGYAIEFVGPESEVRLTGVKIRNNQTKETSVMPVQGAFLAIGHVPSTKIFKGAIPMTDHGTIEAVGRTQATAIPGVFVAGEASDDMYKQVIFEAGTGNAAGLDVWRFLQEIGFTSKWLQEGSAVETKKSLGAEGESIVKIETAEEFEREVLQSPIPVIIDIWTENCSGCKQMEPTFQAIAQEAAGRVKFVKVNGGTARDILMIIKERFGVFVRHMPFVLAFKGGQLVSQFPTVMSRDDFNQLIGHLEQK